MPESMLSKERIWGSMSLNVTSGVVTIDKNTSEEVKEEEQVQVVVNEPVVEQRNYSTLGTWN